MNKYKNSGQVSLEYLIITAFVLIVVGVLAFYALISYDQTINQNKISQSVSILGNAVNQVYAAGPGNTVYVEIDLPKNVKSGKIERHSINYVIGTPSGDANVYFLTNAVLDFRYLPTTHGRHWFRISMGDTNVSIVETGASAPTQAEIFSFDWSTAEFKGSPNKRRLDDWTIENTGVFDITITKMTITWINDDDGGQLNRIRLKDNSNVWTGTADSGDTLTITETTIETGQSYDTGNGLQWTNVNMNDDGEQFTIIFEFEDGSQYVTQTCTATGDTCTVS